MRAGTAEPTWKGRPLFPLPLLSVPFGNFDREVTWFLEFRGLREQLFLKKNFFLIY